MQRRTVADVMRRDVVTISADSSIRELAELLWQRRISGVPVVDERGRLKGVVSSTDILWLLDRAAVPEEGTIGARPAKQLLDEQKVSEIMTPDVLSVTPSTSIGDLLRFFGRTGVHRAMVVEEGSLAGIVSLSDVLGLLLASGPGSP